MKAVGAGGFEQNAFPIHNDFDGISTQFRTFADSREFLTTFGWGTERWAHKNGVTATAAATNGLVGDMNEGSRWNNTVPSVFSLNQRGVEQVLSYGHRQLAPGSDPSGELPPTTPAPPGVSSELTVAASAGDAKIEVESVAGLLAGDQITLGAGTSAELATIASVGTASPAVPLSR